tara:strand:- start:90 stop:344 length:255 start_codon:yes stop_codon:yes gene_type:complete
MPVSSQKTKKESHSAWVRKRNFRRMAKQSQASKPSLSELPAVTEVLKENTTEIRSIAPKNKPKGWFQGIRRAFAGLGKRSRNAV